MRDFPDFVCMPAFSCSSIHFTHFAIYRIIFGVGNFSKGFSSVASVNVRFSWVFYFVFICSGYILNSPHYFMGDMPRPVFIRGFPDFLKSRFSSRILVCWIQWGRERRIILKRFVNVVAWKFLKISCFFFSFCRSVVGTSGLALSATSGPLILQVLRNIWESCSLISPNLNLQDHFLASI